MQKSTGKQWLKRTGIALGAVLVFFYLSILISTWPWLVLAGIGYLLYAAAKKPGLRTAARQHPRSSNVLLAFLTLAVVLSVAEITLRWQGRWGWQEYNYHFVSRLLYTNYAPFTYLFINEDEGWLHILKFKPGEQDVDCRPEFCHTATINAEGCNDTAWSLKPGKRTRIACLGDSFTEGLGATPDSTYEKIWQSLDTCIEVMNCGIRGSDPCYEFMLLQQRIFKYEPEVVVMSVNNSDLSDLMDRGGFERFLPNGTVAPEKRPWWNSLYGCSYLVRLFAHNFLKVDYSLLTPAQHQTVTRQAFANLQQAIDTTAAECQKRNIRFVVNFHPTVQEFTLRQTLELDTLLMNCRSKGLKVVNLHQYFLTQGVDSANAAQYYWPMDGHHNNRGYALMAKGLHRFIP